MKNTLLRDEMSGMTAAEKAAHIVRNWCEVDGSQRLLRIMITDALNDHAVTCLVVGGLGARLVSVLRQLAETARDADDGLVSAAFVESLASAALAAIENAADPR